MSAVEYHLKDCLKQQTISWLSALVTVDWSLKKNIKMNFYLLTVHASWFMCGIHIDIIRTI